MKCSTVKGSPTFSGPITAANGTTTTALAITGTKVTIAVALEDDTTYEVRVRATNDERDE